MRLLPSIEKKRQSGQVASNSRMSHVFDAHVGADREDGAASEDDVRQYALHYIFARNLIFMCFAAVEFDRSIAFNCLDKIQNEFFGAYPYADALSVHSPQCVCERETERAACLCVCVCCRSFRESMWFFGWCNKAHPGGR